MRIFATPQSRPSSHSPMQSGMLTSALLATLLVCAGSIAAQSPSHPAATTSKPQTQAHKARAHQAAKKQSQAPPLVAQPPPPPPMPDWPVNDKPSPASVVWDATGLRINASNSSLQQILNEVSTETGTKVEGLGADQRVYGSYGPGQARDVLSQLLQGSGYNVLLAGDLGQGAPREMVLSPRRSGGPVSAPGVDNRPQQDPDEDIPEQPQPEEQPQPPPVQVPQSQGGPRPGFGPNGPIRTPQQVMEEMQQRQILMQQQQQQQQQQQNPQD
jgi:hypothetical protein